MTLVLIVGLLMNAIALPLAAKRVFFLYQAISHGQPAPDRIAGAFGRLGNTLKRQAVEVMGQKKLLKWSLPGAAHFFVFWAFVILATVYLEAYGNLLKILFQGNDAHLDWGIPIVGDWPILGFLQDFIAMMAFFGILTFVGIRIKNSPKGLGRKSRFFGSHLGPAYLTLFMIFNVIWTMFLFRGASSALGNLPYESGAFISIGVGNLLDGISEGTLEVIEGIGLLLHIGVMLVFLIFVLNSKHLHIFVAPLNVMFGREPIALGAAKPMISNGKALTLDDFEDLDEDAKLGVGAAEDFSWKGVLDFASCTECGRCQDQCPAWNTEKPLSPKLMIMALRDHTLAKTPYLLADEDKREAMVEADSALATEVERPLVGDTGDDWFYMPENGAGVIDPDVLWSCVTCGACVQQCPVDIEHVDHIVDMRRYQVLVESNFPAELNGLFKGMENKGNPWNMSSTARMDWAKDLPFEVKVVGEDIESLDEVDWLFWVGCAGAYEDRAKKTTRAVAELLHMAGVSFGVLGNGETCTGDSARRAGNEFVFQGLAQQNIETFKEYKVKKAVTTCAHCFNTLKNEYRQLGIELDVVHHTQLLNRLVRAKKLTPISPPERSWSGPHRRPITYHDPCYLGRHNQVFEAPRELLNVLPDTRYVDMPRNQERSFCCGAGGARMWMEETIGTRINETRTAEAIGTGAEKIATGCPFCRVMLSDGLTAAQSKGEAREEVEVVDVAQLLLASVKGESKPKPKAKDRAAAGSSEAKAGTAAAAGGGTATATIEREATDEATEAETDAGDTTQTEDVGADAGSGGGSSLFDLGDDESDADDEPADQAEESKEEEPEAKADDSGGSLFDLGDDESDADDEPAEKPEPEDKAEPEPEPEPEPEGEPEKEPEAKTAEEPASSEIPEGGSLFDIEESAEDEPEAKSEPEPEPEPEGEGEDAAADSTTDEDVDRSEDAADTDVEPDQDDAEAKEKVAEAEEEAADSEPAASSGAGITPSSEIPEGGSLFDIAEPEEETVASPASDTSTDEPEDQDDDEGAEPEDEGEDAAADSTTDEDVDRSEDAADPDVEPDEDEADEKAAVDRADDSHEEPDEQPSEDEASGLGGKYPAGESMFDVPDDDGATDEPTDESDDESKAEDESDDEATDEPADESDDESGEAEDDADSGITSLKDIKAKYSGETAEQPDDQPEESEADEDAKPKPASSGDTHEPKTDKDIGEASSLFDL